jgi:F0F1-type ATP synthase membrane subunit c/vacuolar-type H+-ATPase subunit K
MLSDAFRSLLVGPARTLNMIWLAIAASIPIYAAIVRYIASGSPAAGSEPMDVGTLRLVFGVIAAVSIAGSYVYRQRALGDDGIVAMLRAPTTPPLPGSEDLDPAEQRASRLVAVYQTKTIIVLALRESAAVLGVILAILSRDFWTFAPFGAAALLTIGSQPPALGRFMERAVDLARRTNAP